MEKAAINCKAVADNMRNAAEVAWDKVEADQIRWEVDAYINTMRLQQNTKRC